jgi:hypothetical protein
MAAGVNAMYQPKSSDELPEISPVEVNIDEIMFERLHASGLLYSHITPLDWVLVLANSPHTALDVEVHSENEVKITLNGIKPSLSALQMTQYITKIQPDEWGFEVAGSLSCEMKIAAPRPLVTDKSKIRVEGYPSENPLHIFFCIPFYEEGSEAFHFPKFKLPPSSNETPELTISSSFPLPSSSSSSSGVKATSLADDSEDEDEDEDESDLSKEQK